MDEFNIYVDFKLYISIIPSKISTQYLRGIEKVPKQRIAQNGIACVKWTALQVGRVCYLQEQLTILSFSKVFVCFLEARGINLSPY